MSNTTRRISIPGICARGALSVALASAFALPGVGTAGVIKAWAAGDDAKDEVVYVKGDATGATQGIYVVNVFDTDSAEEVSDPADYTSVTNLTTNEALQQEDGKVKLTTTSNEPFYYQGDMDAGTQLPWTISVKYYLDDAQVQPSELSGASGELRIVFDVQALDDDSDTADFASSYLLQAQGTFAEENFAISDAGDATLAHSGSNEVVSCLVLPGESETFEVKGTARDFQYDGWQIAAMSLSMAVDLADQDISELTDSCDELEDATSQLSDGADELEDGSDTLSSGASKLASGASSAASGANSVASGASSTASGAKSLASGASKLSSGVNSAVSGLSSLSSGGKKLSSGWSDVYSGIKSASDGASKAAKGSEAYADGLKSSMKEYESAASQVDAAKQAYATAYQAAVSDPTAENIKAMNTAAQTLASVSGASGAYSALQGASSSYSQVDEGIQSLSTGASSLKSGASSFDSGLSTYLSGASSAASQASKLSEGASSLSSGASKLAKGTKKLSSGASSLADGTKSVSDGAIKLSSASATLSSGASKLASGNASLADSVNGMDDKILDQLQETIDKKLGSDFKAHSFVTPSNTDVDDVQFVYVLEGVDAPDDEDSGDADDSGENQTFFDRLFALFFSDSE